MANKPGALAELAGKLAKKGINIDSAYATMPKGAKKAVVVLGASKAGEKRSLVADPNRRCPP